jgi:hypothetical protein
LAKIGSYLVGDQLLSEGLLLQVLDDEEEQEAGRDVDGRVQQDQRHRVLEHCNQFCKYILYVGVNGMATFFSDFLQFSAFQNKCYDTFLAKTSSILTKKLQFLPIFGRHYS